MLQNEVYRVRQDVILTQVCGEYILVSTKNAREHCPSAQHINKGAALIWKRLESGAAIDDLKEMMKKNFRIQEREKSEKLENDIRIFLNELKEAGYLLDG